MKELDRQPIEAGNISFVVDVMEAINEMLKRRGLEIEIVEETDKEVIEEMETDDFIGDVVLKEKE